MKHSQIISGLGVLACLTALAPYGCNNTASTVKTGTGGAVSSGGTVASGGTSASGGVAGSGGTVGSGVHPVL